MHVSTTGMHIHECQPAKQQANSADTISLIYRETEMGTR